MIADLYPWVRPFLFGLDEECTHNFALAALQRAGSWLPLTHRYTKPVSVMGLQFPHAVGLAAGFDKNGVAIDGLLRLGFAFVEVGTVTPRPQLGNPKPRLFRLISDQALINSLGFNNQGVDALVDILSRRTSGGIVGINIGKNKTTPNDEALADYQLCMQKVYPYASYITVNISSPNTPGLKALQHGEHLVRLLGTLKDDQERLASSTNRHVPMAVKISPDNTLEELDAMAEVFLRFKVEAIIATNTTITREQLKIPTVHPGGMSGAPLFSLATFTLKHLSQRLSGKIPLIGVGGVLSGEDAKAKCEAGASLVQIYSGLIYRGPSLIQECVAATQGIGA